MVDDQTFYPSCETVSEAASRTDLSSSTSMDLLIATMSNLIIDEGPALEEGIANESAAGNERRILSLGKLQKRLLLGTILKTQLMKWWKASMKKDQRLLNLTMKRAPKKTVLTCTTPRHCRLATKALAFVPPLSIYLGPILAYQVALPDLEPRLNCWKTLARWLSRNSDRSMMSLSPEGEEEEGRSGNAHQLLAADAEVNDEDRGLARHDLFEHGTETELDMNELEDDLKYIYTLPY